MVEHDDNRPYISGWDTTEHYNTCRGWFKHDGLFHAWTQDKKYPISTFGSPDEDKMTPEQKAESETAYSVISFLEDKIREELWEHAEELDKDRERMDHYINGLQDALRYLGGKKKEEDEDDEG